MNVSRRILFRLATSERFEELARRRLRLEEPAYRAALRYVAGRTLDDALAVARDLSGKGLASSLDFFGEQVSDPEAARIAADRYLELARAVRELNTDVYVSIDLSHVGLDISADFCREQLERIIRELPTDCRIQVGAEDAARTDRVIEVILALAKVSAPAMATLQANLRRSPADGDRLTEAGIPIRLVKGAYVEPPSVAHPWGEATDTAYVRLAHKLAGAKAELAIATHDRVICEALLLALPWLKVEMLLGVRPHDAEALAQRGHHVRLYVPYGQDWFRYWMRRLAESQGAYPADTRTVGRLCLRWPIHSY